MRIETDQDCRCRNDIRCATDARSNDVEVALVRLQLGHGHMLQRDRVVHIGGDYNIAMPIVLRGGEKGLNICKL